MKIYKLKQDLDDVKVKDENFIMMDDDEPVEGDNAKDTTTKKESRVSVTNPGSAVTNPDPAVTNPDPAVSNAEATVSNADAKLTKQEPSDSKQEPSDSKPDAAVSKQDSSVSKSGAEVSKPDAVVSNGDEAATKGGPSEANVAEEGQQQRSSMNEETEAQKRFNMQRRARRSGRLGKNIAAKLEELNKPDEEEVAIILNFQNNAKTKS